MKMLCRYMCAHYFVDQRPKTFIRFSKVFVTLKGKEPVI